MGTLFATIQALATGGNVRVSAHGFEELASDDISLAEILDGLTAATSIEEYPDYHKGPCILVLQTLNDGSAVHVLWGMAKNSSDMATLITAYRPDPDRWTEDFLRRKPK
jgi:hypothetical protein